MINKVYSHENLLEELAYLRETNKKLKNENRFLQKLSTKSAKENQKLSEERFAKIFNLSPDMMLLLDYDSAQIIDVNQSFLKATGLRRNEVKGHDYTKLGHVVDNEDRRKLLEIIKKEGSIENQTIPFWQATKELGINLVSGTVIESNGKPFILLVGINITEQKKLERKIETSESRFRNAFNYSGIGMALVGLDGDILEANRALCDILGYTEQELQRLTFHDFTHPGDLELDLVYFNKMLSGEIDNYHMEKRYIRKDGLEICALLSVSAAKGNSDQPINFVAQIQDITERKKMETEMLRLDRLNIVGQMAAGIGHEIRNPMTSVRGFLQLFQGKEEYQNCHELLQLMIDELDRANEIISEYLSLAKNREVELKEQDLNEIIKSISPLIFADAIKDDKYLKFDLQNVHNLLLDEKQIRQLILNLVRNGLDAMKAGGRITFRTYAEPSAVVLVIEDQGSGIDAHIEKNIGTPFYTTKDNGTGLGLAICYSIAARHNASINFESSKQGTTFYVRFKTSNLLPQI